MRRDLLALLLAVLLVLLLMLLCSCLLLLCSRLLLLLLLHVRTTLLRLQLRMVQQHNAIMRLLPRHHRAFKTVVFVIDHLDAFMKASKQTLLYNVLDALSSSQVKVRACGHGRARQPGAPAEWQRQTPRWCPPATVGNISRRLLPAQQAAAATSMPCCCC